MTEKHPKHETDGPEHLLIIYNHHVLLPSPEEIGRSALRQAKIIVVAQGNPNIHCKASLCEAAEARRLVERFEWHYPAKHESWLNLACPAAEV